MNYGIINTKYELNGIPKNNLRKRFEYVFHYWTFLFSGYKYDTTISKFESHRTLLNKIELQLNFNIPNAQKYLKEIFVSNNQLFSNNNLLIKNIGKKSQVFKSKLLAFLNTINHGNISTANQSQITNDFKYLKRRILKNYTQFLTKNFFNILIVDRPLNDDDKNDLKYLVNSFIAELFHYGYEKEFIAYVISAITFTSHPMDLSFNFPFDKTKFDFHNDQDFKDYIIEEKKNVTLKRQIECLVNLLQREKKAGFAIFKINNINLIENSPIRIWDTEIYNPQVLSKLKGNNSSFKLDLFKQDAFESRCNIILPYSIPDTSFVPFQLIERVYQNVNSLYYLFGIDAEIDNNNCILANENLDRYFMVRQNYRTPSLTNIQFESAEYSHLSKYNKLKSTNELHAKIQILISFLGKTSSNRNFASIKDLWTILESLFSYKESQAKRKEELIKLAMSCYKLNLKKYFYINNYNYLLHSFMPRLNDGSYSISLEEFNQRSSFHGVIKKSEIKAFAKRLKKKFGIEFFHELINKSNNLQSFNNSEIKKWIEYTIGHAYSERNLEVHNNIKNEISYSFLFDDFKRISSVIIGELVENIKTKDESAKELFSRLNIKANNFNL